MRTALVTGGSGFLGSFIADELSRRGFGVRILDRQPSPHLSENQEMLVGDIRDPETVQRAASGCNVIFHLAALADLEKAHGHPREAAEINIQGTINALEAARS